jgi:penicillin-binding protein 1C
MALGGEGITLRDLAMLYAALDDGGVARPLAFTQAQAAATWGQGRRLVSADAARQVLDILRESPPPADRAPPALSVGAPKLAFKTGTSFGFRDAVAAGVGDGYTVAVWTGRPDGGVRPGMTGRDAALPLLFEAFDAIEGQAPEARSLSPEVAPAALTKIDDTAGGPLMLFPPNGAAVIVDGYGPASRGLALAARGENVKWYVDGSPLKDPAAIWRPDYPGFYSVTAVDDRGRVARARVRVK